MKKKAISAVLILSLALTACGAHDTVVGDDMNDIAETTAAAVTETEAPKTEAEKVAEETSAAETTEATTEAVVGGGEKLYNTATLTTAMSLSGVLKFPKEFAYYNPPAVGEHEELPVKAVSNSDGTMTVSWRGMKTISLPEWGIDSITVCNTLFPDDESVVLSIPEDRIQYYKFTNEKLVSEGFWNVGPEEPKIAHVSPYIFYEDIEDQLKSDEYIVFDDSVLYPGAFSRRSADALFQTWRTKATYVPKKTDLDELTGSELFRMYYPYYFNQHGMNFMDEVFALEADGYQYFLVFTILDDKENWCRMSVNEGENNLYGATLFRIKDGICQGFMYLTRFYDTNQYEADYVLNHSLQMTGLENVTGGKICENFNGQ